MFRKREQESENDQIRQGELLAQSLPPFDAPDSVWMRIEDGLANSEPQIDRSINGQPWFRRRKTVFAGAAAFAVLLVAFASYQISRMRREPGWEVAVLAGSPLAGDRTIRTKGHIEVGEWLETDAHSRARVKVANIGTLTVEPRTRLQVLASRPDEQRIRLAKGEMRADVKAPPRIFLVDTPSARAIDLGCLYTLTADATGGSLLRVRAGSVAFDWKGRETLVPTGASCRTDPIRGPGVPRYEDAPDALRKGLEQLEQGGTRAAAVDSIVGSARDKDAISLWHLLYKVDGDERAKVYDRMSELVPAPVPVSRGAALRLDPMTLDLWKESIRTDIFRREMEESLPSD